MFDAQLDRMADTASEADKKAMLDLLNRRAASHVRMKRLLENRRALMGTLLSTVTGAAKDPVEFFAERGFTAKGDDSTPKIEEVEHGDDES